MDNTIKLLKSLADPTRLRVMAMCRHGGDLTVSEIVRILGQSQPRVSRHLKLLTDAGALDRIPEGSWVFYRLGKQSGVTSVIDALLSNIPVNDSTLQRDQERLERVKSDRDQAASKYFSENAAAWNSLRALHIDQEQVNTAIAALGCKRPIRRLLDLGTGTGEMLRLFAPQIETGEGIDLSRDMLAVARSKLEEDNLDHCRVRQGDLYALPFPDDSFDTVVVHQVLHFVDDVASALNEAARVLVDGGQMLIADFAPHDIEDLRTTHQHRRLGFANNDFDEALRQSNLDVLTVQHLEGAHLTVTIWHARKSGVMPVKEAMA